MRLAYYGDSISPNITKSPEGYLICKNVPIGRLGKMQYYASEIGIKENPDALITVTRDAGELFALAALASFEGKPVTNEHPPDDVEPSNYANYSKGHVQNVRRGGDDSDKMLADLFITDPQLISEIENGKREVSSGYDCQYEQNSDGDYFQRQIRGNHVAVVDKGRAGQSVSIKDSQPLIKTDEIIKNNSERSKPLMSKKKKTLDSFLKLFAGNAKDAKTTDELGEMVEEAAEAIVDIIADKAEEKAEVQKEEVTATDSGGDAVLAAIEKLTAAVQQLCEAKATDNNANPGKESPAAQNVDSGEEKGDVIAELIEELTGKDVDNDGDSAPSGDLIQQEEALTVEAETMDAADSDNSVLKATSKDAALAILKNARPAIAAIKDPQERKRVTDALAKSVRAQIGNPVSNIMTATAGAAKAKAQDSVAKNNGTFNLEAQQAAYDKYNPHLKNKK